MSSRIIDLSKFVKVKEGLPNSGQEACSPTFGNSLPKYSSGYLLDCSACNVSNEFHVKLRSENPNDIDKLICTNPNCRVKFAPATIQIDIMEKIIQNKKAMYLAKIRFFKLLSYALSAWFIIWIIFL